MILRKMFVYQEYPENLMKLYQLAYNFWWAWDYQALNLFHRIDTQLFREADHNPVRLLYSLPKERIEALSSDKGFLFELGRVWEKFQEYLKYVDALKKENNRLYGIGPDLRGRARHPVWRLPQMQL
jgi:starch phosphorylase